MEEEEDDDGPLELPPEQLTEEPALDAIGCALAGVALAPFAGRAGDEVLPEELSERQRQVVALLATNRLPVDLPTYGLDHAQGIERLLGLAPPGPLDLRLELGTRARRRAWPIWRWLRALRRGEVAEAKLGRALVEQLAPARRLELCLDIVSGAYRARGTETLLTDRQVGFLLALVDDETLLAPLRAHADRLAAEPYRQKLQHSLLECALVVVPLARAARARGGALDARYDEVLVDYTLHINPPDLGREVLASLPLERREPRVLAVVPSRVLRTKYMTLCPTPAVAAHTVRNIVGGGRMPAPPAVEALVSLGEVAVPAIDRALAAADVENRDILEQARARLTARSA